MHEWEFSKDEIFDALQSCNDDKSPGPDDFNLKFIQTFWPIRKEEVHELFKEFHQDGEFVKNRVQI